MGRMSFLKLENSYHSSTSPLASFFFGDPGERKEINNFLYVDSLVTSMFVYDDCQITRRLLTSTNNYFIRIEFKMNQKSLYRVQKDLPEYFTEDTQNPKSTQLIWNRAYCDKNNFAELLEQNKLGSEILKEWYAKTTAIIETWGLK